jgi:folate-binding protein YgfZ
MTEGYKALTEAAALIDLSERTRIRATGDDRARLLHALTTNHIQQMLPGHGCYAFFLNANGRVLSDANLLVFAEHILIDAEPEVHDALWAHLDHYIIADDVTLQDDTETTFCLGVEGPKSREILCAVGAPTPANDLAHEGWMDLTVAHASATGAEGYRIFGPAERKRAAMDLLYLIEASSEDWEIVRLENARPRYTVDFTAANIAAETGQKHALHFQKGCYLGQEIVERVRSRGHINKQLVAMEFEGHIVPEPGADVLADMKATGEVTSAAYSPRLGKVRALGYVRVPNDQSGTVIEAEHIAGRVV